MLTGPLDEVLRTFERTIEPFLATFDVLHVKAVVDFTPRRILSLVGSLQPGERQVEDLTDPIRGVAFMRTNLDVNGIGTFLAGWTSGSVRLMEGEWSTEVFPSPVLHELEQVQPDAETSWRATAKYRQFRLQAYGATLDSLLLPRTPWDIASTQGFALFSELCQRRLQFIKIGDSYATRMTLFAPVLASLDALVDGERLQITTESASALPAEKLIVSYRLHDEAGQPLVRERRGLAAAHAQVLGSRARRTIVQAVPPGATTGEVHLLYADHQGGSEPIVTLHFATSSQRAPSAPAEPAPASPVESPLSGLARVLPRRSPSRHAAPSGPVPSEAGTEQPRRHRPQRSRAKRSAASEQFSAAIGRPPLTADDIRAMIASNEGHRIELKKSLAEQDQGLKTLTAFASFDGGCVLFGVTPGRKVVGVAIGTNTLEHLASIVQAKVHPRLYPLVEAVDVDGEKVLAIRAFPDGRLYSFEGRAYRRVGATTRLMPAEDFAREWNARNSAPGPPKIRVEPLSDGTWAWLAVTNDGGPTDAKVSILLLETGQTEHPYLGVWRGQSAAMRTFLTGEEARVNIAELAPKIRQHEMNRWIRTRFQDATLLRFYTAEAQEGHFDRQVAIPSRILCRVTVSTTGAPYVCRYAIKVGEDSDLTFEVAE